MGMAYRHAWEMIDDLNRCFDEPVLNAAPGGRAGGGAELTGLGRDLIERFHAMEAAAAKAIRKDLDSLDARVAGPRSARRRR
jgi:molybdate transport system regulatory protein